jgi:hypothetical protein
MIVRVLLGLVTFGIVALVRGRRRRARRRAAAGVPTITVRSGYSGPQNPIYRIAIERGGADDQTTFTWSRKGERGSPRHNVPVQPGIWIPLEDDIDVRFDGTALAAGDFWTFPARSSADTVTLKARRRGAKPSAHGRAKRRR